jgi:hypothetical protein
MSEAPSNNGSGINIAEQLRSAIGLHQQGRLSQAHAIYDAILRVNPGHADALHLLGLIAYQQRQFDKALELIGRAIAVSPGNAAFHANRGIVLQELKQLDAAIADYGKAITAKPDYTDAYNNRGLALHELKLPGAAIADYSKAIAIRPDFVAAYNNRALALRDLKQLDAAIADYNKAIAIKPDYAEAYNNRGVAQRELKKPEAAIADFTMAIAVKPDYADAYNNRGDVLQELYRLDAAMTDYDRAIALRPDYAEAYYNRGNALRDLGKLGAAMADCDKAIAIRPDFAPAYLNKALTLLLAGDLKAGFELYEWRWKVPNLKVDRRHFGRPLWLGEEPLRDKRILLHSEQGLGDTIQFCRYAPLLAKAGARVILDVPKPLVGLLQNLAGVSRIVAEGEPLPDFDYHTPLLSLPLACKTVLGTIPNPAPYLQADPVNARYWQERIGERKKLKVGVVWSGGFRPDQPEALSERRNIRLDIFARALGVVDVDLFSLQKGDPAESEIRHRELEYWPRGNFHNFAEDITDFVDTAALVANLDLVVSVDTSTAHLAAALGKPTWILNRFDNDWRWLRDREDNPWYRSVKLYRQGESRSWEPVLRRVVADLTTLANEHRAGR